MTEAMKVKAARVFALGARDFAQLLSLIPRGASGGGTQVVKTFAFQASRQARVQTCTKYHPTSSTISGVAEKSTFSA